MATHADEGDDSTNEQTNTVEPTSSLITEKQRESEDSNTQPDTSQIKFQDDLEVLDASTAAMKERIMLCDVVFKDLLAIQRIVKEKCLCDAPFQQE